MDAGADLYMMKPTTPEEREEFLHKLNALASSAARVTSSTSA